MAAGGHSVREARGGEGQQQEGEFTPFFDHSSAHDELLPPGEAGSPSWLLVVALVIAVAVASDTGEALFSVPKVRLFESAVCARYYAQHDPRQIPAGRLDIPEQLCKLDPIQDWLAELLGWQLFFDGIPAILLPIPFGYVADRLGRRWVLTCALASFAMSYLWILFVIAATDWPLHWVLLSSACFLLGGGPIVASNLLTTVVADVVPPESRSTVFFYRFCTDFVANLAFPPVASYLMSKNIWISLIGGVLFQASSAVMVLALPESGPAPTTKELGHIDEHFTASTDSVASSLQMRFQSWLHRTQRSLTYVLRDRSVAFLMWTFLLFEVGLQSKQVLFQYASKRYGWTLAEAALLPSLRSAITIVLFIVILPGLSTYLSRYISRPALRDLVLSKGSALFLFLGSLVLSLSATPALMICGLILFSLGSGFEPAARSLITTLVEVNSSKGTSNIGALYAMISTVEGLGRLIAALTMSLALRIAFHLGVPWYGLPFAVAAVLFAVTLVLLVGVDARQFRVLSILP